MIILGIILLVLGLLLFHPLFIIGIILLVVGLIYEFAGRGGGTRRRYY